MHITSTQRVQTFPAIPPIKIWGTEIKLSVNITSLGIIMDSKFTFNAHVTALCRACYFHFRSPRHIDGCCSGAVTPLLNTAPLKTGNRSGLRKVKKLALSWCDWSQEAETEAWASLEGFQCWIRPPHLPRCVLIHKQADKQVTCSIQ